MAEQSDSAAGEGPAPELGTRAKVIEVVEYGTFKKVRGTCHLIRGGDVSASLKIGEVLEPGDILDLGKDCRLTVAVGMHKTVSLNAAHGRYFRIEKG